MMPILTYYIQTPAIDALVREYGERLELMTSDDRLSFMRIIVDALLIEEMGDPDGTDNAIQAWWLISNESAETLTALLAAVANIHLENAVSDRLMRTQTPGEAPF